MITYLKTIFGFRLITMSSEPIDYLKPDEKRFPSQNYALISVVSPESNQKSKTCGLKIKGVFETVEIAQMEAKRLMQVDSTFDIFLVEVGKWLPIPPNKDMIESQEYQDGFLNDLIQGHLKNNELGNKMFEERKSELQKGKIDPNDNV
jgi:hypothetical protein